MDCTGCGRENVEAARFCAECGAQLAPRCVGCGEPVLADAKFCVRCGTKVEDLPTGTPGDHGSVVVAQRKTITVVFGDVGGSTGLGERLDPEAAREVMHRYHTDVLAVIEKYGGVVDKFNGDGFMATFGIPEVAEDDAARAVSAAVEIQRRFSPFADGVEGRFGGDRITLRVGVNTGEIVIAEGDPDIVGDALNVAARLERACPSGRVLVGAATWRLTRQAWSFEPRGEVTVAGRVEPVEVFLVLDAAMDDADALTPFVGRDGEVEVVAGAFEQAASRRAAQLVTVVGSPGLGKTRLAREAVASLAADHVATVACERAGTSTMAPVVDLIRDVAGLADDATPEAVATAVGAFVAPDTDPDQGDRLCDALVGVLGAGPGRSTEEVFWAIRRLIERVAQRGPLVLVIDDIQWAAPVVLDLLEHLVDWVADAPVLVLCLARPEIRELRPTLTESGRRGIGVVALEGLGPAATAELARRMLGSVPLPDALLERLPASTEGNPLFVRELMKMLVDDDVVHRTAAGWELRIDADAVEVPPTIASLLAARIDRLDDGERLVVERASVFGVEFPVGGLRHLLGDRPAGLAAQLERLRRLELVEPTGTYWGDEPLYRFHHVLIRDAAYRRLLKSARAELHERTAHWLEAAAEYRRVDHDETVAFHEEQAHRYRKELGPLDEQGAQLGRRAATRLRTAAERALARDDLAAASTLAARALACTDEDSSSRAELLLVACEASLGAGDVDGGEDLVDELDALAFDDRLRGWMLCFRAQLAELSDPGQLVQAEQEATRAAGALAALGDQAGAAKGHLTRARILQSLGRVGEAEAELDRGLTAAREAEDSRRITEVLGAAPPAAVLGPSPVTRAGGRCLDIVRLLRITTRAPAVEAASMRCQALLEAFRGRVDAARTLIERARRKVDELGLRYDGLQVELFAGNVELLAGDEAAAETALRTAYAGLDAMRIGAETGHAASLLARVLARRGALDEAATLVDTAEQLVGHNIKATVVTRIARAEVLLARGDCDGAVEAARTAIEVIDATDLIADRADAHATLARALRAAGDDAGAEIERRRARELADQKGATAIIGAGHARSDEDSPAASLDAIPSTPPASWWDPDQTTVARSLAGGAGESIVAILGERAALVHRPAEDHRDGSEGLESPGLRVVAVDAAGTPAHSDRFDLARIDDALARLWDRYHEHCREDGMVAVDNPAARTYLEFHVRVNLGDLDGGEDLRAPGHVQVDHRPGPHQLDAPTSRRQMATAVAGAFTFLAKPIETAGDRRGLSVVRWSAPADDGVDPFFGEHLMIVTVNDDGLIARFDVYRLDQLGEARAALHGRPAAPFWQPAAALAWKAWKRGLAQQAPEYELVDHRRGLRSSMREWKPPSRGDIEGELIAVLGERSLLQRWRIVYDDALARSETGASDAGGFESVGLGVARVDDEGRAERADAFDLDDIDAALDMLWGRYHEVCRQDGVEPVDNTAARVFVRSCVLENLGRIAEADYRGPGYWYDDRQPMSIQGPPEEYWDQRSHHWRSGWRVYTQPVATVGDRRVLRWVVHTAPHESGAEPFVRPMVVASEIDEAGRGICDVQFAPEQFDEAMELLAVAEDVEWRPSRSPDEAGRAPGDDGGEARRAPAPGFWNPFDTLAVRKISELARFTPSDDGFYERMADDLVLTDHRPLMHFTTDAAEIRRNDDKLYRIGSWTGLELSVLGERSVLGRYGATTASDVSDHDGEFLRVSSLDTAGFVRSIDHFGLDQVGDALEVLWRRYHEECEADGTEPVDNAAARWHIRGPVLFNLGEPRRADREAPGYRYADRRRFTVPEPAPSGGYLDPSKEWRCFTRPLETMGDHRVLQHTTWVAPPIEGHDPFMNPSLTVHEIDDDGRVVEEFAFDPEQLDEARAQLRRVANREWDVFGDNVLLQRAARDLRFGGITLDSYSADFVATDHRPIGAAPQHANQWHDTAEFLQRNTDRVESDLIAVLGDRSVIVRRQIWRGGFVNDLLYLDSGDRLGRLRRIDLFDVEQVDDALDVLWERYREHCDEDGVDPLDSLVVRHLIRVFARLNLGHGADALDYAHETYHFESRVPGEPDADPDHVTDYTLATTTGGARNYIRPIEIVGDRAALFYLVHLRPEDDGAEPYTTTRVVIDEVDEDGREVRHISFRPDQLYDARRELRAIADAGSPRRPAGVEPWDPEATAAVRGQRHFTALLNAGDNDAVEETVAPEAAYTDHRPLFQTRAGREVLLGTIRGMRMPTSRMLLAGDEHITLLHGVLERDGFATEFLSVAVWDDDERRSSADIFDVDQLDEAVDLLLARRPQDELANDAFVAGYRLQARLNLGDVEGAAALLTDDYRGVTRRSGSESSTDLGRWTAPDDWSRFASGASTLHRVLRRDGDRLVLMVGRLAEADDVADVLTLFESDGQGRLRSATTFDLDQYEEAMAEIGRRAAVLGPTVDRVPTPRRSTLE